MCGIFSQGFAYTCEECASPDSVSKTVFYLDLECSVYWENKSLKHDSHVHRLLLNIEWDDVNCSGCGTRSHPFFCFTCKRCNFHLCIPCVKLPLTATHRYDNHPLKLTYASVQNELGEYYCEICEGTRDPNHWFYYCKDCDFDCHPHCILGRYPQVKLGSNYDHNAHGQHFVTLVDKSKSPIANDKRDNILPCEKCKQPCLGLVFECKQYINIHREGCCPATDLASSSKSPEKS
ncbi:hypothetical protein M0R45_030221 [Rubus argutus]|uniref:DC1 domain-containing protein n=1 Tax=Rubus argutus TaxID=59490 RepID=A0AAW1WEL5_RUBAR